MNRRRRDQLNKARKARSRAHYEEWLERHPNPIYGTRQRGDRYWVHKRPDGRRVRLFITRNGASLQQALTSGWTVDELAGASFDVIRATGLPVLDGVTLQPVLGLPEPNLPFAHKEPV